MEETILCHVMENVIKLTMFRLIVRCTNESN